MDLELEPLQLEDIGARKGKENLRQRKTVVKHVETFLQIMNKPTFEQLTVSDIDASLLGMFPDFLRKKTGVTMFNSCDQYVSQFKNMLETKFKTEILEWGPYYTQLR